MRLSTLFSALATLLLTAFSAPLFANSPTLLSPTNTASAQNTHSTMLTWQAVSGAVAYTVELADNPNFYQATSWAVGTATQQNAGELQQFTTYYWRVRARIGSTDTPFSTPWTFTTTGFTSTPTPSSPANNATNQSANGLSLSWNALADATSYRVEWADNQAFASASWVEITGATTTPIASLNSNTAYYWRVKGLSTNGNSAWSSVNKFTTAGFVTPPSLNTPANNALNQAITNNNLRWFSLTGATSYLVWWADNPDFIDYNWRNVSTLYTQLTPALQDNTTYYWKVLARNNFGDNTTWSAVRTFKTASLDAPALSSPVNGAVGVANTGASLSWAAVSGATGYTVEIATNPRFLNATILSATATSKATGNLTPNTTYYTRLKSTNAGGVSSYSAVTTFSTAALNAQAILVNPANLSHSISTTNTTLSWNALAGAASYSVEYADNPSFTNSTLAAVSNPTYQISTLSANTTYFWRVVTNGVPSAVWSFSTALDFASSVTLNSPSTGSVGISTTAGLLTWNALSNATNYEIQLSPNSNFSTSVITYNTTTISQTINNLLEGVNYYWRVRASNAVYTSAWSTTWQFTTKTFTTAPVLAQPTNNTLNASVLSAPLSWNHLPDAVNYDIQISPNNNWTSDIRTYNSATATKTIDTLAQNTTYYWRVRGQNSLFATSAWSTVWQFTTTQLAAPSLVAPSDNTLNIPVAGTSLTFNSVPNSANYEIEIAPTPTFAAGVTTRTTASNTIATGNLQADYRYYWRVRGVNVGGSSSWSPVWSFQTVDMSLVSVTATSSEICAGNTTTLTAIGGLNYAWSNGNSGATISVSPATNTNYVVTITKLNGATATVSQLITVNATPTATLSGATSFCLGNQSLITTSSSLTVVNYAWSSGANSSSLAVSQSGVYTVTVTTNKQCTATASITVTQLPQPTLQISGAAQFCLQSSTSLLASSDAATSHFLWSTNATTPSITVQTPGLYRVTVTNLAGCTAAQTLEVSTLPLPEVQFDGATTFCVGARTTITALGAATYAWANGLGATPTVSINTANTYTVTATATNGCASTATVAITELSLPALPVFSQVNDSLISTNTAAGNTVFWYYNNMLIANATTSAIQITQPGNYRICVENVAGCLHCATDISVTTVVSTDKATTNLLLPELLPNPAADFTLLRGLPKLGSTVQVFDATGQLLETLNSCETSLYLNTNHWQSGFYVVLVRNLAEAKIYSLRLIIL